MTTEFSGGMPKVHVLNSGRCLWPFSLGDVANFGDGQVPLFWKRAATASSYSGRSYMVKMALTEESCVRRGISIEMTLRA